MPAQVPKGLYEKDGNFDRHKCRAEHFYFVSEALNFFFFITLKPRVE